MVNNKMFLNNSLIPGTTILHEREGPFSFSSAQKKN
jgi:hypothetical protein